MRKLITISVHVLAWLLFFSLPFLLVPKHRRPVMAPAAPESGVQYNRVAPLPEVTSRPDSLQFRPAPPVPGIMRRFRVVMAASSLLLISFFYLNWWWLLPRLWKRYGLWRYLAGVFVAALIAIGLPMLWRNLLMAEIRFQEGLQDDASFDGFGTMVSLVIFGLVWAVSSGLWFAGALKQSEQKRIQSENARLDAELAQLKSQLNPHFLFNTLNGIYALALQKSDGTPDAVLRLSQLLRYVLTEGSADFVPVANDLAQLQAFVQLHAMRLSGKTTVQFELEGTPGNEPKIAPLLLLPFVENAFKYGVSTREESTIVIHIKLKNNQLYFYCNNKIVHTDSAPAEPSGIGIANTQRRLELIYPNRHQLIMQEKAGYFEVQLTIDYV